MKYVGSKDRHTKELIPIILSERFDGQFYVEPFLGGASMISRIAGNRIGSDANPHVIALWRAVRDGWVPPTEVSEDEYKSAKDEKAVDALTAFIGFACSFAAKWFGGYARGKDSKGNARNYAAEGSRGCLKKAAGLAGADLISCSYDDLRIPPNSIIYCDPPYLGTQGYATGSFDHEKFWLWCDDMVHMGHKVFVSEYQAPDGWIPVWDRKVVSSLDKNTGGKVAVERLFTKDVKYDQG